MEPTQRSRRGLCRPARCRPRATVRHCCATLARAKASAWSWCCSSACANCVRWLRRRRRWCRRWCSAATALHRALQRGTRPPPAPGDTDSPRERALSEAAAFALRIDVAEELARLTAHLDEIERLLGAGGEIGKRLDFLIQELHREANTLGLQIGDAGTDHHRSRHEGAGRAVARTGAEHRVNGRCRNVTARRFAGLVTTAAMQRAAPVQVGSTLES